MVILCSVPESCKLLKLKDYIHSSFENSLIKPPLPTEFKGSKNFAVDYYHLLGFKNVLQTF